MPWLDTEAGSRKGAWHWTKRLSVLGLVQLTYLWCPYNQWGNEWCSAWVSQGGLEIRFRIGVRIYGLKWYPRGIQTKPIGYVKNGEFIATCELPQGVEETLKDRIKVRSTVQYE